MKIIIERTFVCKSSVGAPDAEFTFLQCEFKMYSFWCDAFRRLPGFALIAVCSSVIYRKYTNSNDSTTVVVLSHLGCTDMDLQQNMDNNA